MVEANFRFLLNEVYASLIHQRLLPFCGGMIASAVHPLIYGASGQGGLAGIFHGAFGGKQDPVKVSTDMNTAATIQNSAAVATLTAVVAGFMGMGAPAMAAGK